MVSDPTEIIDGVEMYRISDVDEMPPFLMTIVSDSDLWMFVSSTGGLTAGREVAETCLFPYETDDRLHDTGGRVGPATVLRVTSADTTTIWTPFVGQPEHGPRSLLKSALGNALVFEEEHTDLGVTIRYRWAPSDRFGWVRTVSLQNLAGGSDLRVEVVDGLLDVMPFGIGVPFQQQMSNLANAYRRSEIIEPGIGLFSLESLIVDRPEPAEALRATSLWSCGLQGSTASTDPSSIAEARAGRRFSPSSLRTGRPGSFIVSAQFELRSGQTHRWHLVADVAQSHADIALLAELLASDVDHFDLVESDIARSSAELDRIVASADGVQRTASGTNDAHHLANTLFNVMRGGIFAAAYTVAADQFRAFVWERNRAVARRHTEWLDDLPDSITVQALRALAAELGDPNLERLAAEYLPLAFSRRHGDPSRPWNQFAIRVKDDRGEPLLNYQGNWRDIFQNWEALSRSYPDFLPSIITKFLNASTADGFNPYRITSEGIDWEVLEPDNPWSGIGYWGDHQIIYLLRLLESQERHQPGWLAAQLGRAVHTYADVPYRIVPFEQLLRNPKATVDFDESASRASAELVSSVGADGKLLVGPDGQVLHVTFFEKLLVPALTKLSNLVLRGGIWMNTQRPEWNDANNALVGHGLSMVTLAHLRRYLRFLQEVLADQTEMPLVSADVVEWAEHIAVTLESLTPPADGSSLDDEQRHRVMCELGRAFSSFRSKLYSNGPSAPATIDPALVQRLLSAALLHLDDAVHTARRPDGLYDGYNLLRLGAEAASVERLPQMLEGQVAAITSGLLSSEEVVELIEAMYRSDLYREDVDTFVLYPARVRPPFTERNRVPQDRIDNNPLLVALLAQGTDEVIVRDASGQHRFNADFSNVRDLETALDRLAESPLGPLVAEHGPATRDLFEHVFNHHRFTGRSATMYAFEGIGSVYWHMVAKLLVALQEQILGSTVGVDGTNHGEPRAQLTGLYERVRNGLGFNRTAKEYGAFPTDPYSHTPAHSGAQQPGMTGQVKEELLTRWAELGLTVNDGAIRFTPVLLSPEEFITEPQSFRFLDVGGAYDQIDLAAGQAAFTVCQVPVIVQATSGSPHIVVSLDDGTEIDIEGSSLDVATSRHIFGRTGHVHHLTVDLPTSSIISRQLDALATQVTVGWPST